MTAEPLEHALDRRGYLREPDPFPDPRPLVLRTAQESDLPELRRLDEAVFQEVAYPAFLFRQLYDMYAEHLLVLDDGEDTCAATSWPRPPRSAGRAGSSACAWPRSAAATDWAGS